MDNQSLRNVLGILRLLKAGHPGETAFAEIQKWAGNPVSAEKTMKVALYVIEQGALAKTVIQNSQLSDEAKAGVIATLDGINAAFSLGNIHSNWGGSIKDATGAIGNLVILLSALGIATESERLPEVEELIADIEAVKASLEDPAIDPAVRDVALRHIEVLITLLRHIPIFGVEPALATYFELMMKLRRADIGSTTEAHEKAKPIVQRIEGWGKVLSMIDKAVNAGARLLQNAGKAKDLLSYLPDGM